MKKNITIKILVFFLSLLVYQCSSSLPEVKTVDSAEETIYKNNLRINSKQIYCWVNKMPGSKARFHVSGELELLDNSDYEIENTSIEMVEIIQNDETIYQFTPKVREEMHDNGKKIIFSTIRGLLLTLALDSKKSIDVKIFLSDSANEIKYIIPKVKIEEVQ